MSASHAPVQEATRPAASLSGVVSLLGRVIAFALIVGAGVVGWFAIDEFDVGIPNSGTGAVLAESLPKLGDGLPDARLQSPLPWRRFALTYQEASHANRFWVDLDSWQLRIESATDTETSAVEINGDRGFARPSVTADWVEKNVQETRDIASSMMTGIGPFVLTDLVPPNTLGFTTLELEGTSRGERVYEVAVDAATLQEQHPLAYRRWIAAIKIVNDTSGIYRIRVREDGYIVRIDGERSSVQWDELVGGVTFFSPLAQEVFATPATAPAVTVPDGAPAPAEAPASDN